MRILIVGAGATGGFFGLQLARADRDVTLLVRPQRRQQLAERGLRLLTPSEEITVAPTLVEAAGLVNAKATFDLVLLAVKNEALESALADLEPAVGPDTLVLPVLNGVKHIDTLVERFGAGRVVVAAARVVTALTDDGDIRQLTPLAELEIGERPGAGIDLAGVRDEFSAAGIQVSIEQDMEAALWSKWAFITSVGAVTTLGGGSIGEVARVPGGAGFATAVLDEVAAVFTAAGHPPAEPFLHSLAGQLTDPASALTSSLYRDLIAGRPTEHEGILGDLVDLAALHHVPTPTLAASLVRLRVRAQQAKP